MAEGEDTVGSLTKILAMVADITDLMEDLTADITDLMGDLTAEIIMGITDPMVDIIMVTTAVDC